MYEILFWFLIVNIITIDIFIFYYVFNAYRTINKSINVEGLNDLLANNDIKQ